jgi:hypothetical protein
MTVFNLANAFMCLTISDGISAKGTFARSLIIIISGIEANTIDRHNSARTNLGLEGSTGPLWLPALGSSSISSDLLQATVLDAHSTTL